ncbi:hypothetical protein HUU42_03150 [bacterium]|nr:hypothetical protein [bacterium]
MKSIMLISLILLNTKVIWAQSNISLATGRIGIREIQNSANESVYRFYPEVAVGGQFFSKASHWEIYGGYWDENQTKILTNHVDKITYSSSAFLTGARLYLYLDGEDSHFWPVHLYSGYLHQFEKYNYVGGFGEGGDPGKDFSRNKNLIELGIGLHFAFNKKFACSVNVQKYFSIANSQFTSENWATTVGIGYCF